MRALDRWVDRYLRRLAFGQFLKRGAEWFAGFLFTFGSLVLLVKLFIPTLWPEVLWLALVALPVTGVAWFISRTGRHSRAESAALLDRKLEAGGLLMTLSELPDERWTEQLPRLEREWKLSLPRFRPVRFSRYLALPLIFAVGAGFVPLREETSEQILRNSVGRQTSEQLEEILELLDEAEVLEEEEQRELEKQIEQLKEETDKSPLTHEKWETVDALREKMQNRLETAEMTVAKAQAAAAALAQAMENGTTLSKEQTAQLEKDIRDALQKMSKPSFSKASAATQSELERLLKNGRLSRSQQAGERKQTLSELQQMLKKESQRLGECRGKCKQCQGGNCTGEGFNKQRGPDGNSNRPGRGGVNRGRGDANMSYGEKSDKKNSKFKDVALPPGFFDEPKEDVIATTPQTPDVDPAAAAPRGARRLSDPAAGRETWSRKLRPRHRGVVRRYFDSNNDDSSAKPNGS